MKNKNDIIRSESSTLAVKPLPLLISPVIPAGSRPGSSSFRTFRHFHQGFTLIELLVVVLIIGILAAVALPQYQKAVGKTRLTNSIAAMETTIKSSQAYYLANGSFPDDKDALDIQTPCLIWKNNKGKPAESFVISCELYDRNIPHTRATFYSPNDLRRYCVAYTDYLQPQELCKTTTGKINHTETISNLLLYRFE